MSENTKRFDDYMVDCNKCEPYWLGQCDGVKLQETKNCTAYKATREVDIPQQINKLKGQLRTFNRLNNWIMILLIIHCLQHIIFGG